MKVPAIIFTEIKHETELEDNFLYLAMVYNEEHDSNCHETLLYSSENKSFVIWDGNEYIDLDEWQEVVSVAKLYEYRGMN